MSSDLILAAELVLFEAETAGPCGPDGMLTYVQPSKVRSTNPGYCFLVVGWLRRGYGKKTGTQRKLLLGKPLWLAGIPACEWIPRQPTQDWLDARASMIAARSAT